jgi:hypothetical protein
MCGRVFLCVTAREPFDTYFHPFHRSFETAEMAGQAVRTLPTPLTLDDFDVGVTLGTGSFGRVRFATHKV